MITIDQNTDPEALLASLERYFPLISKMEGTELEGCVLEGADTAVLVDHNNHITEGPGFNIFAVIDGTVVTPRSGMLEGISRKTVLEICAENGIPSEVRDITDEEFLDADEIFTATTGGGPVPVTRANGRILGNDAAGEITRQVLDAYWDWHSRPALNSKINYGDA